MPDSRQNQPVQADHQGPRRAVTCPSVAFRRSVLAGAALLLVAAAQAPILVTQKGRAFNPGVLSIKQGDTLEIINDDGELIHHAYVASDSFSFDSGDQEPGSKIDVVFSVKGHFTVLCGIHPKMHLSVNVQ